MAEDGFSLTGKVAIVTGGSSGIGAASVRRLAAAGARVVVGYSRGLERAEKLLAELPGTGHCAMHLPLEDTAQIRRVAAAVSDQFGRGDILVNSAGFTRMVPHADLEALDDDLIDAVLTANVRGPFATIRAFSPLLRVSGNGVIVNISSGAAARGGGSSIIYGASKAALDTMSMALARVLAPEIRVIVIAPGLVHTGFVPGRAEEMMAAAAAATPLHDRRGTRYRPHQRLVIYHIVNYGISLSFGRRTYPPSQHGRAMCGHSEPSAGSISITRSPRRRAATRCISRSTTPSSAGGRSSATLMRTAAVWVASATSRLVLRISGSGALRSIGCFRTARLKSSDSRKLPANSSASVICSGGLSNGTGKSFSAISIAFSAVLSSRAARGSGDRTRPRTPGLRPPGIFSISPRAFASCIRSSQRRRPSTRAATERAVPSLVFGPLERPPWSAQRS